MRIGSASRDRVVAWMNLQQTNRVIEAALEERLQARTNLSWPEFELLWRLQIAAEHPLRMNEIADQLLGSPSGVTRMADRLPAAPDAQAAGGQRRVGGPPLRARSRPLTS